MNFEDLSNGTSVWVPIGNGWIPATVTSYDESETYLSGREDTSPIYVTVEVRPERLPGARQFRKIEARHLRLRDRALRGKDRPADNSLA